MSITLLRLILILVAATLSLQAHDAAYLIRHYDLQIKPDFATKSLTITATIAITNPELTDAFGFGLNGRYSSVRVTSDSSPIVTQRSDGEITVTLKRPAKVFTLSFELKGNLAESSDEDCQVVTDSSLFLLWSDRFYPIDFDHWATVTTSIILPPGFQVIAPGKLTKTQDVNGNIEYVFETTNPTVCFSVFADARWIKTEREINGIRMQTLLHPESQRFSDQIFMTSSEILDFYAKTLSPYPFDQYSFATIRGMYARRAFPSFVGYEPHYLEREFTTTGHDAHETALLWWGYTTHGTGPGSFQWTESFGDYAEILYDEAYRKPLPAIFQKFRSEFLALPTEEDVLYTDLRGNTPQKIVHGKYPWLMHLMRYVVGDTAFHRALRLVFEKFRFRTFSMPELISTLEEGCSQSLTWWRQEWLERKGVPEISITSHVETHDASIRTTVDLKQLGEIYHLPLPIGIETAAGTKIERVYLDQRAKTFTFDSAVKPKNITLDPDGWLLIRKVSPK